MKPYKRDYEKIRRNELCPCGSELKYKNCCLKKITKREQDVFEYFYNWEREDVDTINDNDGNDNSSVVVPDTRIIVP